MSDDADLADRIETERQWPITVKLKRPVEYGDETIASLVFQRGRMGDLKGMSLESTPTIDQALLIASRMCRRPLKVLELLDEDDGVEVLAIGLGFFARSLGRGGTR